MNAKVSKNWQYYVAYLIRKLWTLLAVSIVTLAVAISVLRYSLPHMDEQKHYLQDWLKDQYGVDVSIGYISAIWKGKGPAIVLKDLTLEQNANSPIALTVDETQIELDFWSSVSSWQVQSRRFNLIGLELNVDLPRIQNTDNDFPILDALMTLFLEQLQRFSVSNSEVLVKTTRDQQKIQIQQLGWLNKEDRHQGVGQMRVAELARNSASFVLDLHGSKDDFAGLFYAEAEDLDLSPWLKEFIPTEYELERSRGNFRMWAGVRNTRVTFVQANFLESHFVWQGEQATSSVTANLLKGDFYAAPSDDGWDFNFDDFTLIINEKLLRSNWTGGYDKQGNLTVNAVDSINLSPLLPMVGVMMGEGYAREIEELAPDIAIHNASFFANENQFGTQLDFSQLSIEQQQNLPGVDDVFGQIFWLNDRGVIRFAAEHSELQSENLLGFNLPYSKIEGEIQLDFSGDNSYLLLPELSIVNEDIDVRQAIKFDFNSDELFIAANASDVTVAQAKKLFPANLMGRETQAYLNRALVSGVASDAQVMWQGRPQDFPFTNNEGAFQASVKLRNAELSFDESWPSLENLDVDLMFENAGLTLSSEKGSVSGLDIVKATGVFAELSENAILEITATGKGTATQFNYLMQNSSLRDSVGAALNELHLSGDVSSDLSLSIPMTGTDVVAKGKGYLVDNSLYVPSLDMTLSGLQGTLEFENDLIETQGMTATLLGQEISVSVSGMDSDLGYNTQVKVEGNWDISPLMTAYHPTLAPYLKGTSDWRANVDILIPSQGYQYNMQIVSQLNGIESRLPGSLQKQPDEDLRLIFDSEGNSQASTVRMLVGNDIKFNGIFPHLEKTFSRAHLSIGGDNFVGMGLGFSISADLEHMDYAQWYPFVVDLIDGLPTTETPLISAPQRIFIEAEQATVAGQTFDNVEILAKHRDNDWLLDLDSEQARANITVYKDWLKEGVKVDADFVKLDSWNKSENNQSKKSALQQRNLPPLNFVCKQCELGDYELGQITLNMSRAQSGMNIDLLEIRKRDGVLSATGHWHTDENEDKTRIAGNFLSDDFGAFLKTLDFDSGLRDSDSVMDFNLNWSRSPFEFNTETLGGNIDWRLGDGYLTEVSDKGARIFSILSLDSLVRKLRLDFRDVFAKGFFYDKMEGTFQVTDGIVQTKDAVIDGAAAKVSIDGYTDITDNVLNYKISVQPNVTSSLPVLLAWMVNPATAVAAFALDEVLTSANVISGLEYSLTGTLQEPVITELERNSQTVELPAKNNIVEPPPPVDEVPVQNPTDKPLDDSEG